MANAFALMTREQYDQVAPIWAAIDAGEKTLDQAEVEMARILGEYKAWWIRTLARDLIWDETYAYVGNSSRVKNREGKWEPRGEVKCDLEKAGKR